jgi:hypothetical protein
MNTSSRVSLLTAAALCLTTGLALAQSDITQKPGQLDRQAPGVSSTDAGASSAQPGDLRSRLAFTADQRRMMRQYVVTQNVAPVVVQERLVVGRTVPADVELMTVPAEWGPSVTGYRYVYADDNIYFVEPSSRQIVQIID